MRQNPITTEFMREQIHLNYLAFLQASLNPKVQAFLKSAVASGVWPALKPDVPSSLINQNQPLSLLFRD